MIEYCNKCKYGYDSPVCGNKDSINFKDNITDIHSCNKKFVRRVSASAGSCGADAPDINLSERR